MRSFHTKIDNFLAVDERNTTPPESRRSWRYIFQCKELVTKPFPTAIHQATANQRHTRPQKKDRLPHGNRTLQNLKNKYIKSDNTGRAVLFLIRIFGNFTFGNIGQAVMLVVLAQIKTNLLTL